MSDLDALIDRLSADTRPVPRGAVRQTLILATLIGGMLAVVGVLVMGVRPDMAVAASTGIFWIKLAYGASLALPGMAALALLVRPEMPVPRVLTLALVPFAVLSLLGIAEVTRLSLDDARAAWLGTSWAVCPVLIALLALPLAAALFWFARQFAPTRLRATGATIGFAAGALAAAIYALHCPESGASFVATWYTLGVGMVTVAGYVLGPRVLRW